MKRRTFLSNTVVSAIAVSTTGFIRFDGERYVGDCETTTDVLGPYYRPDSPVRNTFVMRGEKGDPVELFGKILHNDCTTPYKNAKVELWHCNGDGKYDNESTDFKYRGTAYTDDKGNYSFKTILPVPYGEGNNYRPAHFHLMITAAGYQPLVTQLYFTGDPFLSKDKHASAPTAQRRILNVQTQKSGAKKVEYNVGMSEKLMVEPTVLGVLVGTYIDEKDSNEKADVFINNHQLWMKFKGEPFGENLEYVGDNTFSMSGYSFETLSFAFDILPHGQIKMKVAYKNRKGEIEKSVYVRQI